MEALLYGVKVYVNTDNKSLICIYYKKVDSPANKVVGIVKGLRYEFYRQPWQGQCGCGFSKIV